MRPITAADAELWMFVMQICIFVAPIILSYPAYRQVRAPHKTANARDDLKRLGMTDRAGEIDSALARDYTRRDYVWPIIFASGITMVFYSMSHPAVVMTGFWVGVLETEIDIFTVSPESRMIWVGRALFWGWFGAYIYTLNIIWRRFMNYDLTPSVYIYAGTRMAVAGVFGGVIIIAWGLVGGETVTDTLASQTSKLAAVSLIAFFVGFFPDQGLDWISVMSRRLLGSNTRLANETRLSELEGLSIWHQGRLQQQDIGNVQNLATADIPLLVVATPFRVSQIIDWIDQAILLMYANEAYKKLDDSGIRCASDFITATSEEDSLNLLAASSEVPTPRLRMLRLSVANASNIQITAYYRWHSSLDPEQVRAAESLLPLRPQRRHRLLETQDIKAVNEYDLLKVESEHRILGAVVPTPEPEP